MHSRILRLSRGCFGKSSAVRVMPGRTPAFIRTLFGVLALAAPATAWARPLSLDLGMPRLTLLGQAVPPPPVVLPPGPPEELGRGAPVTTDTVRLSDGRVLHGKILRELHEGLLFRDSLTQETVVLPFTTIVDIQSAKAAPAAPAAIFPTGDRRLFLQGQIRDVQARYDALSIAPAIEEIVAGAVAIAGAVLFLALGGMGTAGSDAVLNDVFAALIGIPGALSLIIGTVDLISTERQESALQDQLDQLRHQLAGYRSEIRPAVAPPVFALRF